ncbi:MAG: amidohydrolase family protein [Planctomycetota bacterium]|nr:amidohydrolase family protein [Planctomycetota bacterium]
MSRRFRWSLALIGTLLLLGSAAVLAFRVAVGSPSDTPEDLAPLSPGARTLVESALSDFRADPAVDHHVHVVGTGEGGSGARVNARFLSWLHPRQHVQFLAYERAFGIADVARAESESSARFLRLARAVGVSRYALFAFDAHYAPDGSLHEAETEYYVPNEYVERLARQNADVCFAVASIHPYRPDAVQELERCAAAGTRILKWLPNAMGMDPADPRCDPLYAAMARLGVALLSHAGEEQAIESEATQEYGNPLRLRRALDAGVRVYVGHCASRGQGLDLDDPERKHVDNFDLFLRLMDDPRYVGRVFGEISALTQVGRSGRPLATMLARTDLHERLVNGSDYPLPAIDVLFQTGSLRDAGYLTAEEARQLDEIWSVNPLLFDLVLKRTVKHPETGARFPASAFRAR